MVAPVATSAPAIQHLAPLLNTPESQTISSGMVATYFYTLTAPNEAVQTINLATMLSATPGIAGASATVNPTTVQLGGVRIIALTNGSQIESRQNVLSTLSVEGDITQSGIGIGDTVEIDGSTFAVEQWVPARDMMPAQLVLKGQGGTPVLPHKGDLVARQQAVTLAVKGGINTQGNGQNVVVSLTASDAASPGIKTVRTTVTRVSPGLLVKKYVRNVSVPNQGAGAPLVVSQNTYFAAGVTGAVGDTLEYLIQVIRSGGAGTVVRDPLPDSLRYLPGTMAFDNCESDGVFSRLTDAVDGDAGRVENGNPSFLIQATPGNAASVTCSLLYRVQMVGKSLKK